MPYVVHPPSRKAHKSGRKIFRCFKFDAKFDPCCVKFGFISEQKGGQISAINLTMPLNLPRGRHITAAS